MYNKKVNAYFLSKLLHVFHVKYINILWKLNHYGKQCSRQNVLQIICKKL